MSAKILETENSVVTLELTIPSDEFKAAITQSYQKNKKYFTIQGFRKGKAPRKVIEAHYGKGVFLEDAIDFAFPNAYKEALKETEIQAVTRPELDKVEKCSEEEGAVFIVKVAVMPEVELKDYKGAEIESLDVKVTDEDIAERLKEMAQKNARIMTEDESPAELGDIVVIDYEGFVDDVAFEGGKDQDSRLELGSNTFIPGFEDQLVGTVKGDEVDVKVTFPADYHAPHLAAKDAVFKVVVKEHFKKVLPRIDDDFAKDVSEFDTIAELNADIREKLIAEKTKEVRVNAENKVVDYAVENAEMTIPEMMITEEADRSFQSLERQMQSQGIKMEDYLTYTNTSFDDFKAALRPEAEKNIRIELVLSKIAEVEDIQPTEEELDEEIKVYADAVGKDLEEYKESVDERFRDYLGVNIKRKKTIDFLVDAAVQK